jgi:predicted small metal-binding protein
MRTLVCKELGFHCDYMANGETIHEVLRQIVDHIEDHHLKEWAQKVRSLDTEQEKNLLIRHIKDDNRTPI